jgi:hypothetical protein
MERTQNSYNINKSILYIDEPMYKQIDTQGNIKQLTNSDALAQAFKLWLTLGKGEKVRTTTGGVLVPHLGKSMTDQRANDIKNSILRSLNTEFTPQMTITTLNVIADTTKNRWVITIEGYSSSLEVGINTYALIDNKAA